MYWEHKVLVDKDGKLVGASATIGDVGTKEITSVSKTVYEYDPASLKIEAPIK
jgi:hypothetical protein